MSNVEAEGYDPFYDPFVLVTRDGQVNMDSPAKPLFVYNEPATPQKIEDVSGLSFFSDSINIDQCRALWDSLRPWLKEQGYTLYTSSPGYRNERPHLTFFGEQKHPFAYFVNENPDGINEQWEFPFVFSAPTMLQFAYGQDEEGRHVIVKPVQEDTDEFRILECLFNDKSLLDPTINIGVIPVLDILRREGQVFVIMPRWGTSIVTEIQYVYEVFDIIESCLNGLVFLHQHRIFHRDIRTENILINHLQNDSFIDCRNGQHRASMSQEKCLRYALNDFNVSLIFPQQISLEDFRISSYLASWGIDDRPYGVLEGELEFNPFLYDVGCLGIFFCEEFQHLSGYMPFYFLAPLLDGMVTADLDKRLSAVEALSFFKTEKEKLTEDELNLQVDTAVSGEARVHYWRTYDRWAHVPPEFKKRWKHYQMTKPSWFGKFIRRVIQSSDRGAFIVYKVRRFEKLIQTSFQSAFYYVQLLYK
ncbi:hypothetical protein HYPSUDRAFT_194631 [Hypholoma sublateritium FD-334 SS-4]|uniref:Protein kinase domain-containing protein n=1 Tax=Hypholoma sublateritium (strain FD-334 SS-4) TaxID=945553 RepID=A0A0D2LWD4_HYPSF|nr:hypothetical protein HYPSUDRAFT_194631 [Hypholoma sublateritium FD-334 SS-4]